MARSEAPAPATAKAAGNGYPLRLPPPRQSSTLHECCRYPGEGGSGCSAVLTLEQRFASYAADQDANSAGGDAAAWVAHEGDR